MVASEDIDASEELSPFWCTVAETGSSFGTGLIAGRVPSKQSEVGTPESGGCTCFSWSIWCSWWSLLGTGKRGFCTGRFCKPVNRCKSSINEKEWPESILFFEKVGHFFIINNFPVGLAKKISLSVHHWLQPTSAPKGRATCICEEQAKDLLVLEKN